MGNWRDAFPSKWFSAKDLTEGPMLLTIKNVSMEDLAGDGGDRKPVVWFLEHDKGLGLNITNGNTIEEIATTPDPDKWPGVVIVAFPTTTDYQGKRVPCVRIRPPKPGAKLPEPVDEFTADEDVPF